MITGLQIRAARALLRWKAAELAEASGLSLQTVQRLEQFDGFPASHMNTINAVYRVLQAQGIEFIGAPDDAPGVRLHNKPDK
ncbi:MAG: transcriptional regulator [Rhodospirillales bacterium]|nr:transcriptional regulator [Rhodospirillales bacterium]